MRASMTAMLGAEDLAQVADLARLKLLVLVQRAQ
jgi:hypothetical protein